MIIKNFNDFSSELSPFYFFQKELDSSKTLSIDDFSKRIYTLSNPKSITFYYIILTDILKLDKIDTSQINTIISQIKEQLSLFLNNDYLCSIQCNSIISKQFIRQFYNWDENSKSEIINMLLKSLETFDVNQFSSNDNYEIDDTIYNSITTEEFIYLKNNKDGEHIYLYESGLIIEFKGKKYKSTIEYVNSNSLQFIKNYIMEITKSDLLSRYTRPNFDDNAEISVIIKQEEYKINYLTSIAILLLLNHTEVLTPYTFLGLSNEATENINLKFSPTFDDLSSKFALYSLLRNDFYSFCYASAEELAKNDGLFLYKMGLSCENKNRIKALHYFEKSMNAGGPEEAKIKYTSIKQEIEEKIKKEEQKKQYEKETRAVIRQVKKSSQKACLKMQFTNADSISVYDSKLGGIPYLPIGETYPVDSKGNPIPLFFQVNFKDVNLSGYPTSGIFQYYYDLNSYSSAIRFFRDTSKPSQTVELITKGNPVRGTKKIVFEESTASLNGLSYGRMFIIKDFFDKKDAEKHGFDDFENFINWVDSLLESEIPSSRWTLGGYPLANDVSDCGEYIPNNECLFVMDSLDPNKNTFILEDLIRNICIKKEDLTNGDLDKAYEY